MKTMPIEPDFHVAGQLAPDDLAALAARGYRRIVNNRPDGEEPDQPGHAEIEAAARAAGLDHRFIPLGPELSRGHIEAMAQAIGDGEKVLAFCRSGRRSVLLWALAKARLGGDPDEIAAIAAQAGHDLGPVRAGMDAFAGR